MATLTYLKLCVLGLAFGVVVFPVQGESIRDKIRNDADLSEVKLAFVIMVKVNLEVNRSLC